MATVETIDQCLIMLSAMYPFHGKANGVQGATIARDVFILEWRDIDDDLLVGSVLQWMSTKHEFHPSAGEIRQMAYRLLVDTPSAEEAWIEVKRMIHECHMYKPVKFSHPLIERSAKAIGWEALCLQTLDQESANRAHFMQIYRSLEARSEQSDLMLPEVKVSIAKLQERHQARRLMGDTAAALSIDGRLSRLLKPGAK